MIELLVSLAIMAALLAAIAAAMHAAIQSYESNDRVAAVTQTARGILGRMVDEIRTADAVSSTASQVTIVQPNSTVQVQYELASGTLYKRVIGTTTTSYVLLAGDSDVQLKAFTLSQTMGQDSKGVDCTKSITVKLDVSVGNTDMTVTASASPRRNQNF